MVKSYLDKCRQELMHEQIDLADQIQRFEMLIKERMELIQFIESSEDDSFDSFSPQNYKVGVMDQESIDKIKNDIEQYRLELEQLESRQNDVMSRIDEIDSVILYYRGNDLLASDHMQRLHEYEDLQRRILISQEMDNQDFAKKMENSLIQSMIHMNRCVEFCTKLMDVDRDRCRIELSRMSDLMSGFLSDMNDFAVQLFPLSLKKEGIDVILDRYTRYLSNKYDAHIYWNVQKGECSSSEYISVMIFRIVQKICSMILEHLQIKNVWIDMECRDMIVLSVKYECSNMELVISDRNAPENHSSIRSLWNQLDDRIRILSGSIELNKDSENETIIHVIIPNDDSKCFT